MGAARCPASQPRESLMGMPRIDKADVRRADNSTEPRQGVALRADKERLRSLDWPAPQALRCPFMPRLIKTPERIVAAGNLPKLIDEFVGRVNTDTDAISIARMQSPAGWFEPGQTPEFTEYTLVLRGCLRVTTRSGAIDVRAGEAIVTYPGEWVQYGTPTEATEYVAICTPAFAPHTVHRDA